MTVLLARNGKEVDWNNKQLITSLIKGDPDKDKSLMCLWDHDAVDGKPVRGSLRTIAHFEVLDKKALRRFNVHFTVIQPPYNTGVPASAGTHDFDAVADWYLPGVDWWVQQRWGRFNGFWNWHRYPPTFSLHNHGFTAPALVNGAVPNSFATRVGIYMPGQLYDFKNHAFGLAGQHTPGSDKSWYPKNLASTVFDLNRFIQLQQEEDMEYKDWSAASKQALANDIATALLNAPLNTSDDKGDPQFKDKSVRWAIKQASAK